jgi:phosphoglycerate dehydrogenase-like enzyme
MNRLRIYVDLAMPPAVRQQLEATARPHELLYPETPVVSVLAQGSPDPQFATVDVAFGQPDTAAIATAPCLKWIHVSSSGITRYDTPAFRAQMSARRILVSNSASVFQEACAVHALSFMLAQARKLPRALSARLPNSAPEYHALRGASGTLQGETILIVGYGAIGSRLAELLQPFHMNVIACRRTPRGDEGLPIIGLDAINDALGRADHVMNILPDSADTRGFFDRQRLSKLKRGAVFYNIGRGVTVDQAALNHALRAGQLDAAWLDVTDPEPLPEDHPLWTAPNCFITPHTAGGHPNEAGTLVEHFLGNLDRFVRGQPLNDRVM